MKKENIVPSTAEVKESKPQNHTHHKAKEEQPQAPQHSFKALFIILEHGYADEVCEFLFEKGFRFNLNFLGKGTATSHILDILGLGDSTRDVIMSLVETSKAQKLIEDINEKFETTGIVFSVRLNSIGGRRIIKILQGDYSHGNTNK